MGLIRVVIADDHKVLRQTICRLLERADDIQVIGQAANGVEAVQLVKELVPDVLILDMEMPKMNGPQVAAHLKETENQVRILALSAYNDPEYVRAIKEKGAAGYITKDQAPAMIVHAVRRLSQGFSIWLI